ncbi:hypothetical protein [Microbispora sp. NPDC046933]|uniref:hypothetical protein n=1 Tax=Microbispora sp. NPDC046933 TaxID=3155618 RepID=UPI0033EDF019
MDVHRLAELDDGLADLAGVFRSEWRSVRVAGARATSVVVVLPLSPTVVPNEIKAPAAAPMRCFSGRLLHLQIHARSCGFLSASGQELLVLHADLHDGSPQAIVRGTASGTNPS